MTSAESTAAVAYWQEPHMLSVKHFSKYLMQLHVCLLNLGIITEIREKATEFRSVHGFVICWKPKHRQKYLPFHFYLCVTWTNLFQSVYKW